MKKIYQIIAMAILILGISSCQKDKLDILGEVSAPLDGDWTSLEQHSYVAQFTIQSNSDWEIESEGDWFALYQTQGSGNATVDMEVVDNFSDTRREGKLTIKFLQDQSKNLVINLSQKSLADIDDNAEIQEGARRYGVGFGYDATGNYASSSSCKSQVFLVQKMINDEIIVMDGSAQEAQKRTYTGSSVYDISQMLSVNAGVDAQYGGFKGEVKASFDQQYRENQFCEYGIYSINVKAGYRNTEYGFNDLKEDYMPPIAKRAIDGISGDYKGEAGIMKLIANFGTHVIKRAYMGGRLDYSMSADVSKIEGEYNISAFLSAGYESVFAKLNGTVDEKYKTSYKNNNKNCYTKVRTLGGSVSAADILAQGEKGVAAWTSSLSNVKNQAMVDFDAESLVPIWELCSDPARAAQIKTYVESYVQGVDMSSAPATKIDIPKFATNSTATLIKTAVLSDKTPIAEICNEYIPILSATQRVTVVYPIVAGATNYKYGFFIGSATQSPGRISWDSIGCNYTKSQNLPLGELKTIYMRGLSVSTTASAKMQSTEVVDQYFHTHKDKSSYVDYPLVKVSSTIWTRSYLSSTASSDGSIEYRASGYFWWDYPRYSLPTYNGKVYLLYNRLGANALCVSGKWIIPLDKHCTNLNSHVNADLNKCLENGVSGLEFVQVGFSNPSLGWSMVGQGLNANIWAGTDQKVFEIVPSGMRMIDVATGTSLVYGFPVRLVRDQNFKYF